MESVDMKMKSNSEVPYLKSMVFCLDKVINDGYKEHFEATPKGLQSAVSDKLYMPNQVKVVNFFRFEGFSDPSEKAIMYVIETDDGVKGTLIDTIGNGARSTVSNFITAVYTSHSSSFRH